MKKWITLIAMNLIVGFAFAQNFETPRDGAKIYLSSYDIELNAASEEQLELWIVRSRKAKKTKFEQPKIMGSKDLTVEVIQDQENIDHYFVKFKPVNQQNKAYFYTVSCKSKGTQKVVGTTISVNVTQAKALTKNNK